MSGFSVEAKMAALRTMLAGTLYLGLGYTIDGTNIEEVDDGAYERQPLTMGEPEAVGTNAIIRNTNDVLFPPWAADDTEPVQFWFVTSDAAGETTIIAFGEVEREPDGSFITPRQGGTLRFLPGDVSLGLSDTDRSIEEGVA